MEEFYNFFANINAQTAIVAPENGFKDFPFTLDYVWILGKKYNTIHDLDDLRTAIRSKIWFSYRSGFPAIGGTGPKSDKNWGCMLRCGQMVMAEALIRRHLGREWLWTPSTKNDPVYAEILKMFQDRKDCPYSIHQIAQMGVSEGKAIGQWFGSNTVAQVLRKLSIYDEWSSVAVHIASATTVIKKDIYTLCRYVPEPLTSSPFPQTYKSIWYTDCAARTCPRWQSISAPSADSLTWRPLLLFIPLRLGLTCLNPIYIKSLKNTFTLKQSIGILGGKPKHAVWFIGYTGNDLVCLDPHVTQPTVNLSGSKFDDSSYHIPYGGGKRMPFKEIDPSICLCFFFESKDDFEDWCVQVTKVVLLPMRTMFEILDERPEHWPPLELRPDLNCSNCSLDYDFVEDGGNGALSEDDFETVEAASCSSMKPRNHDCGSGVKN